MEPRGHCVSGGGGGASQNRDSDMIKNEEMPDQLNPLTNDSSEVKVMHVQFCGMFVLESRPTSHDNDLSVEH